MALEPGQDLLHYRLVEKIGEGGMGVVWKAVDSNLDRAVAIKVLPEAFSLDTERLARFEREARLLGSLNHPHIATVHGLHESGSVRFLAMELVEGQDLSKRLIAGPLSVEQVLDLGRQIAEALEAAHDAGIVHRDLKPANVVVSSEGKVKVLDFGLAKPSASDSGQIDPALSPTLTSAGTQAGLILGTAAYLSPEQAKGHPVDRRTDIWAFGVVMHEMLTGRLTFKGEGISETLAAVILKEPDLDELPSGTPPRVRELVRRCLIKDARKRLRDIGEARIALEETQADPTAGLPIAADAATARQSSPTPRRPLWALAIAVLVVATATFFIGRSMQGDPQLGDPVRLDVMLSNVATLASAPGSQIAVAPDGKLVAYALGTPARLHVRDLEQPGDTVLSGTEGASYPFFSPDGQWLGFFASGKLRKVSVTGGAPLTLADARSNRGAAWGPDGTIVFSPHTTSGLLRVSEAGGEPEELTSLRQDGTRERSHRWPSFLPGGESLLFTAQDRGSGFNEANIALLDLRSGTHEIVHRGGSNPHYVDGGFLVFTRENTLFAARFGADRKQIEANPVPVLEDLVYAAGNGGAKLTISKSGTAVFIAGGESELWTSVPTRVDRTGAMTALAVEPGKYDSAALSPDGRYLAFAIRGDDGGSLSNIWIYDLQRDVPTRLSFGEAWEWMPSWSPDGHYVTFSSDRDGDMELYRKPADGSGDAELIATNDQAQWAGASWSPDGKFLAFTSADNSNDILFLDVEGGGTPQTFLKTDSSERFPRFSPDGRWLAFQSDESAENEIYVRPFPGPGGKWQISRGGGRLPTWSRDGRELFFLNDRTVMAVAVDSDGDSFRAGRPSELFTASGEIQGPYDVDADGSFLMTLRDSEDLPEDSRAVVTFMFNWPTELDRLVP